MDRDFEIRINANGKPYQTFNGRTFTLHPGARYFTSGPLHMHWYVWEHYNGKREKGFHIHHKDGNTWNNEISNLETVKSFTHLSEHAKKRIKDNPEKFKEFYTKGIEAAKEWHKSEVGLQWHKEQGKKTWHNREYKKHNCEVCNKEYETRHSGVSKYCHNNCKAKALRDRRKLERGGL